MKKYIRFIAFYAWASAFAFSQDTTPPVISCPTNITLSNTSGQCGAIVNFSVSATDDSQIMSGNLLVNGNAETNNTNSWTLTNGGDGWAITTEAPHTGTYAFIGSYGMGTMTQVLDLISMGYSTSSLDASPEVNVSEWYKASACCSVNDSYFYLAELLDQSMSVIATFNLGTQSSPINSTSVWQQVQHTFTGYPTGMRYIRIIHGSTDQEFWLGNYGTVIDDSEVSMLVNEATVTYSQNPGTSFPVGTTILTATATDGSGNQATCNFNITVNDVQAPVIPTLTALTGQCSVDNVPFPIAMDNCVGQVTATTNSSLIFTQQGTYLISWIYSDGNGNTSTQNQTVSVNDNMGPTPDVANLPDIIAICSADAPTPPTANDNCTGPATGTTTTQFPITTPGTTVVTWTYIDGHNKTTTQTQNFIVNMVDNGISKVGYLLTASNANATYAWMDCSDNSLIAQETGQTYTATENGNYAVIVTEAGCVDTSDCLLIAGIGLDELTDEKSSIYPNPSVDGSFTIVSDAKILSVEFYDNQGRFINKSDKSLSDSYEFSIASSGTYFAKIELENTTIVRRIVIQKN